MLIKNSTTIYIPSLIFGTILTCSASSWLMAWIGLEINLMSFIPLLLIKLNNQNTENSIKYFLIQAMASILIIFSTLLYSISNMLNIVNLNMDIINASLALKAGVAPMHFWFPQIIASMNWTQAFIILTWQKIAPLILMSYNYSWLVMILIISSAMIGAIGGLNQMNTKKILAFSSIINVAWMMSISYINLSSWWLYFILYSLIVTSVIMSFKFLFINSINDVMKIKTQLMGVLIMFINILSLAGLPPFTGFYIKIIVIEMMMINNNLIMLILMLLISSMISFYFYMRLMYLMLMMFNKVSLMNFMPYKTTTFFSLLVIISMVTNIIMPLCNLQI